MSKSRMQNGHCLCGSVQVVSDQSGSNVGACHCRMCRRWAGGPWLALDCGTTVSFSGKESIGVFSSSDWAERGFCRNCGTNLYYRLKQGGSYYLSAGLFEDDSDAVLGHQVFIDEKPAYYEFANETVKLTGEQVFAQYSEQQ